MTAPFFKPWSFLPGGLQKLQGQEVSESGTDTRLQKLKKMTTVSELTGEEDFKKMAFKRDLQWDVETGEEWDGQHYRWLENSKNQHRGKRSLSRL